jgi:L-ascorbate metabolism protein UlaG (beta-lactamase superfamily)
MTFLSKNSQLFSMLLYFFGLLIVLAILLFGVLQLPQFGKTPTGSRLARIQQSSHYQNGKFQNLSPTPDLSAGYGYWDILKAYTQTIPEKEPNQALPFVKTDLQHLPDDQPLLVWFGHSSYLLKIAQKTFLIDPVFSGNASPFSFFGPSYPGANNYTVDDLPMIDYLLISHDHYDHLDFETVKQLQPKVRQVITSLGTGEHLEYWGYNSSIIRELDWWEGLSLDTRLHLTATPARHFSGRGFQRNQAFWASFVLESTTHRLFLGGDSGYDKHFEEIGEKFGSFDLAILECGQYNAMWHEIHTYPEELVKAAQQLRTKAVLPVHWGKFTLALHPWKEPIERLVKEAERQQMPYATPQIGEVMYLNGKYPNQRWWR